MFSNELMCQVMSLAQFEKFIFPSANTNIIFAYNRTITVHHQSIGIDLFLDNQ